MGIWLAFEPLPLNPRNYLNYLLSHISTLMAPFELNLVHPIVSRSSRAKRKAWATLDAASSSSARQPASWLHPARSGRLRFQDVSGFWGWGSGFAVGSMRVNMHPVPCDQPAKEGSGARFGLDAFLCTSYRFIFGSLDYHDQ